MARQWIALAAVAVVCVAGRAGATTYDWRPGQGVPGVHGVVYSATAWDPDGAGPLPEWLVVAGDFGVAGDIVASNIAAWDGQCWHTLGDGLPCAYVVTLAVYEGDLIAGSISIDEVQRFRNGTWEPMGSWPDGVIARALVVHNGQIFAGGPDGVSRWDGTRWQPLGAIPAEYGCTITSLAVYDGQLIVGGQFSPSGAGACILGWDGQDWLPLGAGLECAPDADEFNRRPLLTSLAVLDGELIAAGNFHQSGEDTTCRYIARWDGQTWRPFGGPVDFFPQKIGVYAGKLVCGTDRFTDNSGRCGITLWEDGQWRFLPGGAYGTAAILEYRGDLIVGAGVTIPDAPCSGVARWDGQRWHALGEGMIGYPVAMGTYNGDLLMAGWFNGFGGGEFNGVLRWNGRAWQPMGSSLDTDGGAIDEWTGIITEYNGDLLIAGRFAEFGGVTCNSLARWGGEDWQPFGGATRDGEPATVWTLFVNDGDLYVGGSFDTVGGVPCKGVARWDGTQWHDMGANLAGNWYWDDWFEEMRYAAPSVRSLTVYDGQLIAGGSFALAEGEPYVNIARWDGQTWQPLGGGIVGINSDVETLAVYDGQLIAGGYFVPEPYDQYTDDTVPDLLAWDGQAWQPLGQPLHGYVGSLTIYDGQLIATGSLWNYPTPFAHTSLARWDGQQWHAMGDTLGTSCGVFPYDGDLIVYRGLVLAHGKVTAMLSRWGPVYPGDVNSDGHVDVADLLIFVDSMGKGAGDDGYNPACDLSGDGTVDLVDLMIMIDDWGK